MDQKQDQESFRSRREKITIAAMVKLYCKAHHGKTASLCANCQDLLDYAYKRIDNCAFGVDKPVCADCPVHCYKPGKREEVRIVMRFAGPRMLLYHPWLTILHYWDGCKKKRNKVAPENP